MTDIFVRRSDEQGRARALLVEHGVRWGTVRAWALTHGWDARSVQPRVISLPVVEPYARARAEQ